MKLPDIPVKVRGSAGQLIPTYAFLENGSTPTSCSRNLLEKVVLEKAVSTQLSISTIQAKMSR